MPHPSAMQQSLDLLAKTIDNMQHQRPVVQAPTAKDLNALIDVSLGEHGVDGDALLLAASDYLKYSPDVSQVGFFKLLYSGLSSPALFGDWVTALSNATMHTYQVSPVATLMELELLDQLNALAGFERGDGVMVSGGSQANLVAMLLARQRILPNAKTQGLQGKTLVAFVSDQAHYSYLKAVNVLGLGTNNLIAVKSDAKGRLDPIALEQAVKIAINDGHTPFFIGLTAGTTVVGAFDPVKPCSDIAKAHGLWLHVDGAWGAPVLFSQRHRHLLQNIQLADSMAWDAHKLMNVPVTAGVILVKQAGQLTAACSDGGGEYLFHSDANSEFNLGERSIQCGRRADALKVWMSWKAQGNTGFANKVDNLMHCKDHCVAMIEHSENLTLIAPANYLNILFSYQAQPSNPALSAAESHQLTVDICEAMKKHGAYIDYARYKGQSGIRLILANEQCTILDVEKLISKCIAVGNEISNSRLK